ncbi:condensation domain-containing protein [Phytohabitans houttuyneae]|uniref:Condensation domain-containing protein n=1 Tax=Phytohabitans houttuyneae TaxID=1076126 RepID=A0A6V8JZ36_9ACTN|nr:condensation domain-containing protein [Phytohabitans houttuyneae]GFJ78053.1 hypothetical protein Phou_022330 [Phytohabitans houttuyneae]
MTAPAARLAEPEARGLTAAEEALWLLQQLAPDRGVTNVAMAVEAAVQLRWWPLNATFEWLVDRHPALRCRFSTVDGRPVRTLVPADELDVSVDVIDGTDRLEERLREYAGRPFDLTSGRPVRLGWFRGGAGRDVFCLVAHHVVIDALSLRVLLAEFNASYPAFADAGEPPPLPEPARAARVTPSADSLRYWRADLAGIDPAGTRLDPAREPAQPATFAADEVEWVYPLTLSAQVADLRARSRSTDAAVLLAGYLVALHSVGMSDDALVGVMASTRSAARASSVGYHVATLPLRIKIDPDRPFVELASTVAARLIAGMEHADVPFEALASELVQGREDPLWWRAGLFRHLFNYRVAAEPQRSPSGRREVRDIHTGLCRFDIELTLEQLDGAFRARLLYSTEVHERTFAAALLERVESVIAQAHAAPALPLRDLDVRTRAEIDLLERVNRTQMRWAGPQTVPELVETAGRDTPDAVALVDGDRQVAYRELCQAAQGVRQALDRLGVRAGDVVALAGRRAPELAAAALGVWWAGAAYLPLDPEHPPSRLREQLADAGVGVVLDGQLLPEGCLDGLDATAVPVQWTTAAQEGAAAPAPSDPDALAYLIYTSGSTGRPKGVRITHRNLANVVRHFTAWLPAGPETTMLWLTTSPSTSRRWSCGFP